MFNVIAQLILDQFPDSVSEHGLLGCGLYTFVWLAGPTVFVLWIRAGWKAAVSEASTWRYRQ